MALFAAAARRAAASSLPLLRASVSPGGIALLRALAGAAARPMPFSSATGVKPRSDDDLPRVIKSETNLAEQCDDHDPDDKNSVPSSDESSPSADESSSSSVRNQEDEGENRPKEHGRRQMFVYEMGDDSSVKFSCTVYPAEDKIVIKALALRPPPPLDQESDEEVDSTESEEVDSTESEEVDFTESHEVDFSESEEVVEFSKLDVKLQLALYKLVKPMGYDTPGITEVLQEPTMSKDRPRLLFWETELWDFLNKDAMTEKAPSMSPFKITDKGLELMSKDEYLRVINSGIKFAVECNNCNRVEKKITGDDVHRYMKMRGITAFSPKFLQETILDKL